MSGMIYIIQRQAMRVVEMVMLYHLDKFNCKRVKEYRIWVKKRIYRENKDVLNEINVGDR
jgi:histone acetyltransferase 1